jgi:hypothetical protein
LRNADGALLCFSGLGFHFSSAFLDGRGPLPRAVA